MKKLITIIFILLFCTNSYATNYCADANNVGCFLMEDDGNETDRSSNTNNTLTETSGDIPQSSTKKFGDYSRDFEYNDSEYLTHADGLATDISGADQKLSLVAYVKSETENSSYDNFVVNKYLWTGDKRQYLLNINTNDFINFAISSDGTSGTIAAAIGTIDIYDTNWHHIAGVYNDTDCRAYVDGSVDSNGANNPKAFTAGIADKSEPFIIGQAGSSGYWDGLIDDVGVFDRELTSVEINDIKTNGLYSTSVASAAQLIMINM